MFSLEKRRLRGVMVAIRRPVTQKKGRAFFIWFPRADQESVLNDKVDLGYEDVFPSCRSCPALLRSLPLWRFSGEAGRPPVGDPVTVTWTEQGLSPSNSGYDSVIRME